MKFLMTGTWDPADPGISSNLGMEQSTTAMLRGEGVVEQLLLRADGAGGYIVLNAESEDDARRYLDKLPFVQQSIMGFELTEIKA
jgi:hypothetical protein